jgi:hypothetical protein
MRLRLLSVLPAALAAAAIGAAQASAYTPPPDIPWESLLPAGPSGTSPQPHPVPGCPRLAIACIDSELSRMRALRRRLGCDHRGVFDTTYLRLTEALKSTLLANRHFQRDPRWLYAEDGTFANMYFSSVKAYSAHKPVPAAWRIAFDAAARGDDNAVQDMLLGINAHVQRDMPYMLASVGLRTRSGASRKPDHDAVNDVLDHAFAPVVEAVAQDFDPIENLLSPSYNLVLGYGSNLIGEELVKAWREEVWRNAERLLAARTPAELSFVEGTIEANAAATAAMIAGFPMPPGYRAQRDAYCRAHLPLRRA